MSHTIEAIKGVYTGSNGDETKALYAELEAMGPAGVIAMNLFRACKCSERAKTYRRGSYRGNAYDRKDWSLGLLAEALEKHAGSLNIIWGWGFDPRAVNFEHVLYVDLPTGQVSFHCAYRKSGPDYASPWDGVKGAGPDRICRHCFHTLTGTRPEPVIPPASAAPAAQISAPKLETMDMFDQLREGAA